ncbi:unnamed protein product [Blepharisma stoltei]|uniref:Uncharacterized protein n=1 Tax=Blepharisma stoltei TaxID=1481888 RepID=A0AAU9J7G3_9CILI|nr:unnamed protein product [Blepharisma stoltei]
MRKMEDLNEAVFKATLESIHSILAPDSLLVSYKKPIPEDQKEAAISLAKSLLPGDIIMTQTPGRAYTSLRTMAYSYFDHVAVLVDSETCLQVGPPRVRLIPSYHFLLFSRKPFVLRVKDNIRAQFLENIRSLNNQKYESTKALTTWLYLVLYERFRITLKVPSEDRRICTDSILSALPNIQEIREKYSDCLDFGKIGSHSLNDFLVLEQKGVLDVVKLPFPFNLSDSSIKKDSYAAVARKMAKKQGIEHTVLNIRDAASVAKFAWSLKKTKYRRVYGLLCAIALYMRKMEVPGNELFQILSLVWPKL